MSFIDYEEIQEIVNDAVEGLGTTGHLRRGGVDRECTYVEAEYSPEEREGSNVQFTDKKVIVSVGSVGDMPDTELDRFVYEGETVDHRIVTADRVKPATVALLYELQVRR